MECNSSFPLKLRNRHRIYGTRKTSAISQKVTRTHHPFMCTTIAKSLSNVGQRGTTWENVGQRGTTWDTVGHRGICLVSQIHSEPILYNGTYLTWNLV